MAHLGVGRLQLVTRATASPAGLRTTPPGSGPRAIPGGEGRPRRDQLPTVRMHTRLSRVGQGSGLSRVRQHCVVGRSLREGSGSPCQKQCRETSTRQGTGASLAKNLKKAAWPTCNVSLHTLRAALFAHRRRRIGAAKVKGCTAKVRHVCLSSDLRSCLEALVLAIGRETGNR